MKGEQLMGEWNVKSEASEWCSAHGAQWCIKYEVAHISAQWYANNGTLFFYILFFIFSSRQKIPFFYYVPTVDRV